MSSRRSQRSAAAKAIEAIADGGEIRMSRSRRTASENVSMATVSRGPAPASSRSPQSMRLTVKTSSSKLREATRASSAGQSISVNSRDQFIGGEILEGKRARNVRKSYVLESDSEEEDDAEMEDVGDDDAEGESVEEEDDEEMDAEDDGLGDEDAEGDIDMELPPPPPVIKISKAASGKQTITAKAPGKAGIKTVERKEVELGSDDDEELSELDSDVGEEVEEEEAMQTGNEEDAEGEEEDIEVEEAEDDDDELDSDDETPMDGSRATTPDLNKLTKRQRARLEEGGSGHLLALPDGKLSHITAWPC
jgi:Ino eighty subunit 2